MSKRTGEGDCHCDGGRKAYAKTPRGETMSGVRGVHVDLTVTGHGGVYEEGAGQHIVGR